MTTPAWNLIEELIAERAQETRPRALGEVIETLLAHFETSMPSRGQSRCIRESRSSSMDADWQGWQIQKERALLPASRMN